MVNLLCGARCGVRAGTARVAASDVKKDRHARQEQVELPLYNGTLILTRAPNMTEEHVPYVTLGEVELRCRFCLLQLDRGLLRRLDELVR